MAQVKRDIEPENNPAGFESLYRGFIGFLGKQGASSRITFMIISLLVAALLMTVSSLPFVSNGNFTYISVLIGFPAGIILFLNVIGIAYYSGYRNTRAFNWKEKNLPARRIRVIVIWVVILAIAFILFNGRILPYGVGGAIVIAGALVAYNVARRTKEELRLARLGLPDPRELLEEEQ